MEIVIGAIVVIIIYLLVTGKKRRKRIIEGRVLQMIITGQTEAVIPIYHEAAIKFAIEHGGEEIHDSQNLLASYLMNYNGVNYSVYFAWHSNGVHVMVNDYDKESKKFREAMGLQ